MSTSVAESAIVRRLDRWRYAREQHCLGEHPPAVCRTPERCDRYKEVLDAQVRMWEEALLLSPDDQVALLERLAQPRRSLAPSE